MKRILVVVLLLISTYAWGSGGTVNPNTGNTNTNTNNISATGGNSSAYSTASSSVGVTSKNSLGATQALSINQIQSPELNPYYLAPLQGGRYGDVTHTMPMFAHPALVKFNIKTDVIVKVLDVYFGNVFSRITYEEVESYLLEKAGKYDGNNIRYSIKWQDSVISTGTGGGGVVSNGSNTDTVATLGILPGVAKTTANPIFIITFYEVAPVKSEPLLELSVKEEAETEVVIKLDSIHFDNNSSELTIDAKTKLSGHIKTLADHLNTTLRIEGHCSMSGTDEYNQKLSEKRAEAVKAFLVENGIDKSRVSTIGYGKTKALYESNPKNINSKEAKENRRVLFVVTVN